MELLSTILTREGPLALFFLLTVLASISGWEYYKGRTSKNDTREDRLWAQNQANADMMVTLQKDTTNAAIKTNENMTNMIQIHGKLSETAVKTEAAVTSIAHTLDRITFIMEEREKSWESLKTLPDRIEKRMEEMLEVQTAVNKKSRTKSSA